MHKKYDALFWWFEENEFECQHNYPRNTALVFAFCDWLESLDIRELAQRLQVSKRWAKIAKKTMLNGCDKWLGE